MDSYIYWTQHNKHRNLAGMLQLSIVSVNSESLFYLAKFYSEVIELVGHSGVWYLTAKSLSQTCTKDSQKNKGLQFSKVPQQFRKLVFEQITN